MSTVHGNLTGSRPGGPLYFGNDVNSSSRKNENGARGTELITQTNLVSVNNNQEFKKLKSPLADAGKSSNKKNFPLAQEKAQWVKLAKQSPGCFNELRGNPIKHLNRFEILDPVERVAEQLVLTTSKWCFGFMGRWFNETGDSTFNPLTTNYCYIGSKNRLHHDIHPGAGFQLKNKRIKQWRVKNPFDISGCDINTLSRVLAESNQETDSYTPPKNLPYLKKTQYSLLLKLKRVIKKTPPVRVAKPILVRDVCKSFTVASALNGCNGEWTNKDDTPGKDDLEDLFRARASALAAKKRAEKIDNVDKKHILNTKVEGSRSDLKSKKVLETKKGIHTINDLGKANALAAKKRIDKQQRDEEVAEAVHEQMLIIDVDNAVDPLADPHDIVKHARAVDKQFTKVDYSDRRETSRSNKKFLVRSTNPHKATHESGRLLYDGKQFCVEFDVNLAKGLDDGMIYNVVDEDVVMNHVVKSGPGWLEISVLGTKGERRVATPCVLFVEAFDSRIGSHYFSEILDFIFIPAFKQLEYKIPFSVYDVSISKSCIGDITKYYSRLSDTCRSVTVNWYIRSRFDLNIKVHGNWDVARLGLGKIEAIDHTILQHQILCNYTNGLIRDNHKPFVIEDVECEVPVENNFFPDIEPLVKHNADFTHEAGLSFTTNGRSRTQWKITALFMFVGFGNMFLTYGNTTNNAIKASKRVFGMRDGEVDFDGKQFGLFKQLASIYNSNTFGSYKRISTWFPRVSSFAAPFKHQSNYVYDMYDNINVLLASCSKTKLQEYCDFKDNVLHWAYYNIYQAYTNLDFTKNQREACAAIEHAKQKLRQSYVNGVILHEDADTLVKRMNTCIKRELAKSGKVPRFFVSYDAGCMYANYLPEFVKIGINGAHILHCSGVTMEIEIFAKPYEGFLDSAFHKVVEARCKKNYVYMAIYSDDSVISGNCRGRSFTYNVDISSCDASNRELVFYITSLLMSNFHKDQAKGLVDQCLKKMRITNPAAKEEYLEYRLDRPYEGSGSVLTTILNHVASFLIGSSFLNLLALYPEDLEIDVLLAMGARLTGHLVTVDSCGGDDFVIEKVQFLKHSYMMCEDGIRRSARNYGAVFRSLGTVNDNLDCKKLCVTPEKFYSMTYSERSDRFISNVIKGLVHEPDSLIMTALRDRFNANTDNMTQAEDMMLRHSLPMGGGMAKNSSGCFITSESICMRYDCTTDDLQILANQIAALQVGQTWASMACTQFFLVDYSLAPIH